VARITIEYTSAAQGGGVGRSVRDLTAALLALDTPHDYTLWAASPQPVQAPPGNAHVIRTPLDPAWLLRLWYRAHIPLPVEWLCGHTDVFFATDFALPPTQTGRTALFLHDLSYVRVPGSAAPSLKAYLDSIVPRSVRRAGHIVVNSQATRDDVAEYYGVSLDKITPVTFGVDPIFCPSASPRIEVMTHFPQLQRPYILAVGTVQPRKNYVRLIEALKIIRAAGYDIDLAIAGGKGWLDGDILAAANQAGVREHVHLLGYVEDDMLPLLYTHAACFVMPSLYEGFGLPILEAMACGTPVVTSDISSMPEAGGDSALFCDPYRPDSIADAITTLLTDSAIRQQCIERGFVHAARHTWQAGAQELSGVFERLLAMMV
jgi:glycosyltransferase involved in cell wall biosynthesis